MEERMGARKWAQRQKVSLQKKGQPVAKIEAAAESNLATAN